MNRTLVYVAVIALVLAGLPPRDAAAEDTKTLQVFILAGQSNMEGHGSVEMGRTPGDEEYKAKHKGIKGGVGSLRHMVDTNTDDYGPDGALPLLDADSAWIVRDDVYVYYPMKNRSGRHSVGFGVRPTGIGPEFGFGHVMGNATQSKVLIIKTCWGGKDLIVDFRPPSAEPDDYTRQVAKQREIGRYYRETLAVVRDATTRLGETFPELEGYTPRIAGFGWHQGWNDGGKLETVNRYEKNLVTFIKDVRNDLGAEDLPFVIANSGQQGFGFPWSGGRRKVLCDVQLSVGDAVKYPDFAGNVFALETRQFCRLVGKSPSRQGYHWHSNGESYFLVGKAMGEAMLHLRDPAKYRAPINPPPDTTTNAGTPTK